MATQTVFDKLNENFAEAPIAAGGNVFTAPEYSDAIGLGLRQTRERLARLAKVGKVRKVRTKRGGKVVPAWEYLQK